LPIVRHHHHGFCADHVPGSPVLRERSDVQLRFGEQRRPGWRFLRGRRRRPQLRGRLETNQLAGRIQNNGRHPRHIVRRIALDDDVHRVLRDQVLRTLAVHEADARLEPVFAVAYLRDVPEARQERARTLGEDLARLRDSRRIDLRHITDAPPDAEGAGDDGGEQQPRQGRLQRALVSGRRDHFG
jgi:hypothetical protein